MKNFKFVFITFLVYCFLLCHVNGQVSFQLYTSQQSLDIYEVMPGTGCKTLYKFSVTDNLGSLSLSIGTFSFEGGEGGVNKYGSSLPAVPANGVWDKVVVTTVSGLVSQTFNIPFRCSPIPPKENLQYSQVIGNISYSSEGTFYTSAKVSGFSKFFDNMSPQVQLIMVSANSIHTQVSANIFQDKSGKYDIMLCFSIKILDDYFPLFDPLTGTVNLGGIVFSFSFGAYFPGTSSYQPTVLRYNPTTISGIFVLYQVSDYLPRAVYNTMPSALEFPVSGNLSTATILSMASNVRVFGANSTVPVGINYYNADVKKYSNIFNESVIQMSSPDFSLGLGCLTDVLNFKSNISMAQYFLILVNGVGFYVPPPYGYTWGTYSSFQYDINNLFSPLGPSNVPYQIGFTSSTCVRNPVNPDTLAPSFSTVNIERESPKSSRWAISFSFTDPSSGFGVVSYIDSVNADMFIVANTTHLVSGDIYNGKVLFYLDATKEEFKALSNLGVSDNANNRVTIASYVVKNAFNDIEISNITNFSFANTMMVSDPTLITASYVPPPHKNTLFFSVTNRNDEYPVVLGIPSPLVQIDSAEDFKYSYYVSYWDSDRNCYRIDFEYPYNTFSGRVSYQLRSFNKNIVTSLLYSSSTLASYFGSAAQLSTSSTNADLLPPLVTSTSCSLSNDSVNSYAYYSIFLEDPINGIDSMNVTFTSDKDPIGYSYTFKANDSNRFSAVANFKLDFNYKTCLSQTFTISKLSTLDRLGRRGEYNKFGRKETTVNPLFKIDDIASFTIQCAPSVIDTTLPTITSITFSQTTFTTVVNQLDINFTIADDLGLSKVHFPVCYASTTFNRVIQSQSICSAEVNLQSNCTCSLSFEHMFGYPDGILISIYGVTDAASNINGYNSNSLSVLSSPNTPNPFPFSTNNLPYIVSVSPYYDSQTTITLNGYNFINTTVVSIQVRGSAYPSTAVYPTVINQLVFNITSPITYTFSIMVTTSNGASNTINYTPLQSELPPQNGSCPNNCGAPTRGNCLSTGCQCISPYYGDSCNSMIIVVDPPKPNSTEPSTENNYQEELPSGEVVNLKSLISLVKISEISFDGSVIFDYPFDLWYFEDITDIQSKIPKFSYTTNFTSKNSPYPVTTVTVITTWYSNQADLTFANSTFSVPPSTMKYNILISSYQFKNTLSKLQLVFLASLTLDNPRQDTCSSKTFQTSQNTQIDSEYIKLSINDHSLFGRFINRGIIDQRIQTIQNQLVDQPDSQLSAAKSQALVGITLPFYYSLVELDPDFSLLVDIDTDNSNQMDTTCSQNSKKGLTKAQLAGIIVGSVCGFLVIALIVGFILYRRFKYSSLVLGIKMKTRGNEAEVKRKRSTAPVYTGGKVQHVDKF